MNTKYDAKLVLLMQTRGTAMVAARLLAGLIGLYMASPLAQGKELFRLDQDATQAHPSPESPLAQGKELFRLEQLTTGTLVSLRDLGAGDKPVRVEMTFKLGSFVPRMGVHLALGVGDLTRYFNRGVAPIGEGIVIGASDICPDRQQISAVTESYYSGTTLEPLTCFSGIKQDRVYRLIVVVTPEYRVSYDLFDGPTKLYSGARTWLGIHAWHTRGLFLIPVSDDTTPGTYQLLKLIASSVD